ncbi:DGQHR domain-containing protein DpdB [Nocardioides yefusunii]|uniref:DGQHR domain-containing protein DpdB n=1 Tax=Nocardioides yefusunii TaxID=2500546 RepID=A0ABW1R3B5_9ACTN|nr:DGQHR domain-containing protein DpdB [Nocardioides yefusunii]
MTDRHDLRLPALQIKQGEQYIYAFGVDGKRVHDFTAVSRVHRDEKKLAGYQRPEVRTHIRAIRRYLESDNAMLPNAIVFAFDDRVRFEAHTTSMAVDYVRTGELVIPIDPSLPESERPAWLVDGQQRSAAIRDAEVDQFAVAAVGFIARGEAEQRSQFILVNNTKPLPKGLIHELLPDTKGHLPTAYARKQLPADVLSRLNFGTALIGEPFAGRIATPTAPDGYIKDNSVLKMIENSLYDGALYQYRNPVDGTGDIEAMVLHLNLFWTAVQHVWPGEWELQPRKSRLTHGAGIQALGFVMDHLTEGVQANDLPSLDLLASLRRLRPHCAWTSGTWGFGDEQDRRWNGIQNTPSDIRLLTKHLLKHVN